MAVSTTITIRDAASRKLERIADAYKKVERTAQAADTATETAGAAVSLGYDRAVQSIERADSALGGFNNKQDEAVRGANQLQGAWGKVSGWAKAAMAAFGAKQLVGLSDTMAGNSARLELIVDDGGSVAELDRKIYDSAMRSRSAYTDTVGVVSKLGILAGDAFGSNDEMIAFAELMNKNFVIGGASQTEQASAMYQLTQAMASGRLQGDEYRSIIENAPLLAQSIEDYMRNVQGAKGSMMDWSSEGLLTAQVIKAALFSTADEVEGRFQRMPMTWGQVWTMAGNLATRALSPLLSAINWLANNIGIVGPLVLGVGLAFGVFQVAAHWTQIAAFATGVYQAVVNFLSIGFGVLTGNTAAASAAVFTFNSALLASPITWIIMGVLVLIAALYAGVAAFNKFTGSSVSATGIIGGAFGVLGAFLLNTFVTPLWNAFAALANFLGNVFRNPAAAIQVLFCDVALIVLGYIQKIAAGIEGLINKIPGMKVDITSGLNSLYDRVAKASQEVKDRSGWVEYVQSREFVDYEDAARAGYDMGVRLKDKIGGALGIGGNPGVDWNTLQDGVDDIAANTGKMAQEVNIADEDIKLLRDVAEMRFVQNFVTLTPTVAMNAQISEKVDVGEVVHTIERTLEEEFAAEAEGVYA